MGLEILIAYVLDLLIGDPRWLPHPVVAIGKAVAGLEKLLRKYFKREKIAGVILALIIVIATFAVSSFIVLGATSVNLILGHVVIIALIFTTLSVRDLDLETSKVYEALKARNLELARQRLAWIVSRDTEGLDQREMIRASIETVAENIVDGIVSPLFYAFVGGAPLALTYKAINTLDSMVGYKNSLYLNFGWASAKLDDIANYIPARLTGLILPLAAWLCGKSVNNAAKIILRDGKNNPSPNSGIPEAGIAGALGIQLGGINYYQGQVYPKPLIGDDQNKLSLNHIKEAIRLMYIVSILSVLFGLLALYLVRLTE